MKYGPVMIDIEGTTLSAKEKVLLQHPAVGGVLLFSRNYNNPSALKALIAELRTISINPLLIAVDHEGGRVWRFRDGFTVLPPAKYFLEIYQKDKEQALQDARDAAAIMASELLALGVDLSLAPVLDLDIGVSEVIGDRSFGSDPAIVTALGEAFIQGMNDAGMQATGKHFPGHGSCRSDTHLEQAIDDRMLDKIMLSDLIPFQKLATKLKAVMPAHVIYPNVDSVPAGYSKKWLKEILRGELGFQGAIISDCLSMKGAAIGGDFVVRARMALDAGCDMVILSHQQRELVSWVLEKLERETSDAANNRLQQLAGDFKKKIVKPKLGEELLTKIAHASSNKGLSSASVGERTIATLCT